jgi:hypothetical protein
MCRKQEVIVTRGHIHHNKGSITTLGVCLWRGVFDTVIACGGWVEGWGGGCGCSNRKGRRCCWMSGAECWTAGG